MVGVEGENNTGGNTGEPRVPESVSAGEAIDTLYLYFWRKGSFMAALHFPFTLHSTAFPVVAHSRNIVRSDPSLPGSSGGTRRENVCHTVCKELNIDQNPP
jgi:hypothetical protein